MKYELIANRLDQAINEDQAMIDEKNIEKNQMTSAIDAQISAVKIKQNQKKQMRNGISSKQKEEKLNADLIKELTKPQQGQPLVGNRTIDNFVPSVPMEEEAQGLPILEGIG
jgi:hypothetical protein